MDIVNSKTFKFGYIFYLKLVVEINQKNIVGLIEV